MIKGELRMGQDPSVGNIPRSHRSRGMRQNDAHHFEATANDVTGTARGVASGYA